MRASASDLTVLLSRVVLLEEQAFVPEVLETQACVRGALRAGKAAAALMC